MGRKASMKSIEIFGKTYKIEYRDLTEEHNFGYISHTHSMIIIDKNLKGAERELTIMHEFLHGVLTRVGVSQPLSSELEEVIVESISTFLVENFHFDFS